ncbi:hypothetical protein [Streptosporangium nondiastaticum]|uniref:hypothetical protein n=1 Tax=Streptosporangium nondiastaticum TaxID=35764 RepID=UPI00167C11F8|nr:hypothetical protein [Streptosporangium nondiastaticum]
MLIDGNDERGIDVGLRGERVAEIYQAALARSAHVVVAGDLNDTPDSVPLSFLSFLLAAGLQDAMTRLVIARCRTDNPCVSRQYAGSVATAGCTRQLRPAPA